LEQSDNQEVLNSQPITHRCLKFEVKDEGCHNTIQEVDKGKLKKAKPLENTTSFTELSVSLSVKHSMLFYVVHNIVDELSLKP
jgi:hypothetical protein